MTVQDVIDSFREGASEISERTEFAKNLFQEARAGLCDALGWTKK